MYNGKPSHGMSVGEMIRADAKAEEQRSRGTRPATPNGRGFGCVSDTPIRS